MLRWSPDPSCNAAVGEDIIESLVSVEGLKRNSGYIVRSYIKE
jgi:hypothetical protein